MTERICARQECGNILDHRHSRYCSEDCRRYGSPIIQGNRFTQEMIDELYEDAKAGRIKAWQEA